MPTLVTELKPDVLKDHIQKNISNRRIFNEDKEEFRKFVDGVLGINSPGEDRTDLEVGKDINYEQWKNATYIAREEYLERMCHAVWNGGDSQSQSEQIYEWLIKLRTDHPSRLDSMKSDLRSSLLNPSPEWGGLDGGNRKNKTRKSKSRRSKTGKSKTCRSKTRYSKTRKNKRRYSKTRKNKRRYSKTRKNKRR